MLLVDNIALKFLFVLHFNTTYFIDACKVLHMQNTNFFFIFLLLFWGLKEKSFLFPLCVLLCTNSLTFNFRVDFIWCTDLSKVQKVFIFHGCFNMQSKLCFIKKIQKMWEKKNFTSNLFIISFFFPAKFMHMKNRSFIAYQE